VGFNVHLTPERHTVFISGWAPPALTEEASGFKGDGTRCRKMVSVREENQYPSYVWSPPTFSQWLPTVFLIKRPVKNFNGQPKCSWDAVDPSEF